MKGLTVKIDGITVDTKSLSVTHEFGSGAELDLDLDGAFSTTSPASQVIVYDDTSGNAVFTGNVTGWTTTSSSTSTVTARMPIRTYSTGTVGTFSSSGPWTAFGSGHRGIGSEESRWAAGKSPEVIAALDEALDELMGMANRRKKPIWKRRPVAMP